MDTFIADLTVVLSTGHLKSDAAARGERVEKDNPLPRSEQQPGDAAPYAGPAAHVCPAAQGTP